MNNQFNPDNRIDVPLEEFKRVFPNVTEEFTKQICTGNVCTLPMNNGVIPLDHAFFYGVDNKVYIIRAALFLKEIIYSTQDITSESVFVETRHNCEYPEFQQMVEEGYIACHNGMYYYTPKAVPENIAGRKVRYCPFCGKAV